MSKYIASGVCLVVVTNLVLISFPVMSAMETRLDSVNIENSTADLLSTKPREEVEDPIFTDLISDRTRKLKQFIDRGGSPDRYLHAAVNSGAIDCVRLMLSRGANVNLAGDEGVTPLMTSVKVTYRNGLETTELLIKKGANINARANKGSTVLMFASWGVAAHYEDEYVNVIRFLIKKGAKVNVKNNMGDSPLSIAKNGNWQKIVAALRKAGAKA